jgi:cytidyltransferase-like protein
LKVAGIVAEYNPFHNGHLYQLEQTKALCSADYVVCVMSGNFIQRGEPAIVDKWARAEMALLCGADLVVEIPVAYAMSSAEYFAQGAVKILDSMNIIDFLCFGSESGSIDLLDLIADILHTEPEEYKTNLKEALSRGLSFPAAREAGLRRYMNGKPGSTYNIDNIMNNSNNILGIEYLKALKT